MNYEKMTPDELLSHANELSAGSQADQQTAQMLRRMADLRQQFQQLAQTLKAPTERSDQGAQKPAEAVTAALPVDQLTRFVGYPITQCELDLGEPAERSNGRK